MFPSCYPCHYVLFFFFELLDDDDDDMILSSHEPLPDFEHSDGAFDNDGAALAEGAYDGAPDGVRDGAKLKLGAELKLGAGEPSRRSNVDSFWTL